jgi:chemotaxis protein MotB
MMTSSTGLPKQTWVFAVVFSGLFLAGLGGMSYWSRGVALNAARTEVETARRELEALRRTNELVRGTFDASAARVAELEAALVQGQARVADLEQQKAAVSQSQKSLEDQMRRAMESKDVTISELQGKLTVSILDRILFDSGEAQLKPEGQAVLRRIADVLEQYPRRQIHVVGHTDNVPIRASSRGRYSSNWELSTARATAAVRFLSEQAHVDPRRLGAVGYGEFHPLADNATAEGRSRNRRIAVVVLSEERAGSDTTEGARDPEPAPLPAPALEAPSGAARPAANAAPTGE